MSDGDLIPLIPGKPGRRQTVTAKAWISRPSSGRREVFQSHVSLGDGRVYTLTTDTARRVKALDFNRSHLFAKLCATTRRAPHPIPQQLDLIAEEPASAK
jgi:hypothetical protein